jgi:hypothetical protein
MGWRLGQTPSRRRDPDQRRHGEWRERDVGARIENDQPDRPRPRRPPGRSGPALACQRRHEPHTATVIEPDDLPTNPCSSRVATMVTTVDDSSMPTRLRSVEREATPRRLTPGLVAWSARPSASQRHRSLAAPTTRGRSLRGMYERPPRWCVCSRPPRHDSPPTLRQAPPPDR